MLRYQMVRVLDEESLVDRELCLHSYKTADGRKLEPGIYVVVWPAQEESPAYDANARYVGPFIVTQDVEPLVQRTVEEYIEERRAALRERDTKKKRSARSVH